MTVPKIDVKQAQHDVEASDALLVCAYDSEEKFASNHLHGAIPLEELQSQEDNLSRHRELIFYCACPNDESSTQLAEEYQERGFDNAKVLRGGVDAWKKAGFEVEPAA